MMVYTVITTTITVCIIKWCNTVFTSEGSQTAAVSPISFAFLFHWTTKLPNVEFDMLCWYEMGFVCCLFVCFCLFWGGIWGVWVFLQKLLKKYLFEAKNLKSWCKPARWTRALDLLREASSSVFKSLVNSSLQLCLYRHMVWRTLIQLSVHNCNKQSAYCVVF